MNALHLCSTVCAQEAAEQMVREARSSALDLWSHRSAESSLIAHGKSDVDHDYRSLDLDSALR